MKRLIWILMISCFAIIATEESEKTERSRAKRVWEEVKTQGGDAWDTIKSIPGQFKSKPGKPGVFAQWKQDAQKYLRVEKRGYRLPKKD